MRGGNNTEERGVYNRLETNNLAKINQAYYYQYYAYYGYYAQAEQETALQVISRTQDLERLTQENNFNFKKLSPDLLNVLTKYMYVASGSIETKLSSENNLIIRKAQNSNNTTMMYQYYYYQETYQFYGTNLRKSTANIAIYVSNTEKLSARGQEQLPFNSSDVEFSHSTRSLYSSKKTENAGVSPSASMLMPHSTGTTGALLSNNQSLLLEGGSNYNKSDTETLSKMNVTAAFGMHNNQKGVVTGGGGLDTSKKGKRKKEKTLEYYRYQALLNYEQLPVLIDDDIREYREVNRRYESINTLIYKHRRTLFKNEHKKNSLRALQLQNSRNFQEFSDAYLIIYSYNELYANQRSGLLPLIDKPTQMTGTDYLYNSVNAHLLQNSGSGMQSAKRREAPTQQTANANARRALHNMMHDSGYQSTSVKEFETYGKLFLFPPQNLESLYPTKNSLKALNYRIATKHRDRSNEKSYRPLASSCIKTYKAAESYIAYCLPEEELSERSMYKINALTHRSLIAKFKEKYAVSRTGNNSDSKNFYEIDEDGAGSGFELQRLRGAAAAALAYYEFGGAVNLSQISQKDDKEGDNSLTMYNSNKIESLVRIYHHELQEKKNELQMDYLPSPVFKKIPLIYREPNIKKRRDFSKKIERELYRERERVERDKLYLLQKSKKAEDSGTATPSGSNIASKLSVMYGAYFMSNGYQYQANSVTRRVTYTQQSPNQSLLPGTNQLPAGSAYPIFLDPYYVQNRVHLDRQFSVKCAAYRDYLALINFTNSLFVYSPAERVSVVYRCFIGKGNNYMLIKHLLKNRWWWGFLDTRENENLNFLWTQTKRPDFIEGLRSLQRPNSKDASSVTIATTTASSFTATSNSRKSARADAFSNNNSSASATPHHGSETHRAQQDFSLLAMSQQYQTFPLQIREEDSSWQSYGLRRLTSAEDYTLLVDELRNRKSKQVTMQLLENDDVVRRLRTFSTSRSALTVYNEPATKKICNHLEHNYHLGNKKALFYNMRTYCEINKMDIFSVVPQTFHIQNGKKDPEYIKFIDYFKRTYRVINYQQNAQNDPNAPAAAMPQETGLSPQKHLTNLWIVKPGEATNRGSGIKVLSELSEVRQILESFDVHKNGARKTYIVQKYIDNPLLYNKRKFDIRCYQLVTSVNGTIKGYWYYEGYVRTSSKDFTLKNLNKFIHLTNDAVQKKDEDYGKYERGNKISFEELNRYIYTALMRPDVDFFEQIYPYMKQIATHTMRATYRNLDANRRENCFELFGLDFMIDEDFKVWLIEVNVNPAIEICCTLLYKIIPALLDNVFRIALDPLFPPPNFQLYKKLIHENLLQSNKFDLVFDELKDGCLSPSEEAAINADKQQINWGLIKEEEEEAEDEEEQDGER